MLRKSQKKMLPPPAQAPAELCPAGENEQRSG